MRQRRRLGVPAAAAARHEANKLVRLLLTGPAGSGQHSLRFLQESGGEAFCFLQKVAELLKKSKDSWIRRWPLL